MATVALGCMNLGRRTPEPEARRIVARALERGITHFDTANAYGDGESERVLARALGRRRADVTVATKCGLLRLGGQPEGLSAPAVRRAIDESVARLGGAPIDVLYLHAPDPAVPAEETLAAVDEAVRAGRVGRLGLSNHAAWQILAVDRLAEARGWPRPQRAQQLYNLLLRQLDVEYLPFAERNPIHTTVYNPLAGGLLARPDGAPPEGSRLAKSALYRRRYGSPRMRELAARYRALASDEGMSLLELAYAWLAGRRGVDTILLGPATVAHLDAGLDGCARSLGDEARARIDAIHHDHLGTDASYAR